MSDHWFFSGHVHIVGKVRGGFVDGQAVAVLSHLTGYTLKNLGQRKSVVGTLFYQLSHAGVSKRVHTVKWFGELAYRKNVHPDLKELEVYNDKQNRLEHKGVKCPVCSAKMVHVCRCSNKVPFKYSDFEDKFVLDLADNWVVVPKKEFKAKFSEDEEEAWKAYDENCKENG